MQPETLTPQQTQAFIQGATIVQPGSQPQETMTPEQTQAFVNQPDAGTDKSINPIDTVADTAAEGFGQIKSGVEQTFAATKEDDPLKAVMAMGRGALNEGAGAVNVLFSLPAGIMKAVGNIPVGNGETIGSRIQKNGIQPIADVISNTPGLNELVTKFPNSPEVIGNVITLAMAVAGGEKAPEIKGVGTDLLDSAGNAIDKTKTAIGETVNPSEVSGADPVIQETVSKRTNALQQVENNNAIVRRVVNDATGRGIDVKSIVANNDLLVGSVDESGTINTTQKGGALDQFREFMGQYESAVSDGLAREGKSVPFSEVESIMKDRIANSKIAGGGKLRLTRFLNQELEGLKMDADENGNISLSKLQDAKISTTNGIDYTKPESKINAKMIADTYKTVIEDNSSLDIKNINAELSKYYKVEDYLEALNGKKVAGAKLGKYFAQTIGGMAGTHFGPLGTIIGAELASKIKGWSMAGTFGNEIGQGMEASNNLKSLVEQNKQPRIGLPAPKPGTPTASNNIPIQMGGKSDIEPQALNLRK